MVRPSYVLGGRAMEVVHDEEMLRHYVARAVEVSPERPILIDKFLENAIETEADAIADGTDAFVPAVMEHIELAGIHSGDSACVIPPVSIPKKHIDTIRDYTRRIAVELNVVGLMNIQYAICKDVVYILEANPRASRTVPLVSKVCNIQHGPAGRPVHAGQEALRSFGWRSGRSPTSASRKRSSRSTCSPRWTRCSGPRCARRAKCSAWPTPSAWPSTSRSRRPNRSCPCRARSCITVTDADKKDALKVAREFQKLGFRIKATEGTCKFLAQDGVQAEPILKMYEGRPNIVDAIKNGEIQLVINTPEGRLSKHDDSYIRKAAIKYKIPYITTTRRGRGGGQGNRRDAGNGTAPVRSLQSYHAGIK